MGKNKIMSKLNTILMTILAIVCILSLIEAWEEEIKEFIKKEK